LAADAGHVDDHFGFAPTVNYHYKFQDSDFGIGATGTFLNLSGRLQRDVASTTGGAVGQLTANSSLTLVNASSEVARIFDFAALRKREDPCFPLLDDMTVEVGVGVRYSSIDQNYTSSLSNGGAGASISTRFATQSFKGIGLTTNVDCRLPVQENWVLFTNTRGSVLVGDNARHSTLSVNAAGLPGNTASIDEDKTVFLPVGELEVGVLWANMLGERFRNGDRGFSYCLKVSCVAQFWGDVGPLSAGSSQKFRESDLFLVGANVLVGIQR
jgi:hypothetical protein